MKFSNLKSFVSISGPFRKPRGRQSLSYGRRLSWPTVLSCVVFLVVGLLGMGEKPPIGKEQIESDLEVFVRQGCPHCGKAKTFLSQLEQRYPQLKVTVHDIGQDPQALLRLKTLAAKFDMTQLGVPAFYVRGELVVGFQSAETTGKHLEELLGRPPPGTGPVSEGICPLDPEMPCPPESTSEAIGGRSLHLPFFGNWTLPELGLPLFTLFLGLLDGFNPCAMWVLLFLLALLAKSCTLRSWRRG
jgi:glutaredoxin